MTYEQVKSLKSEDFKRLCGVRPETFRQMIEVVRSQSTPKRKTGRPGKLSLEDQLLMTLENGVRVPNLLPYRTILGSE